MIRNGLIFTLLVFGALCLASFAQIIDLDSNQTMMVPTCNNIGPSETLLQNSLIDSNLTSISFILSWSDSTNSPEMVLRTPGAHEINQFVEPPIIYEKNDTIIYYIIPNPEIGNWTLEINTNDQSSKDEDYCLFIVQDTSSQSNEENYSITLPDMSNSSNCQTCPEEG